MEAEREYERVWGANGTGDEVGEGGKRKGSEMKEEMEKPGRRESWGKGRVEMYRR